MMDAILHAAPAWALEHAAALIVVAPLLAAGIAAFANSARFAWGLMLAAVLVSTYSALILLAQALDVGVVSYALGGWAPPVGIEYRVDMLNAPILLLVCVIGLACAVFASASATREVAKSKRSLFYCAFLLCFAGLLGVAITGDAFNLFVFLEVSSLSTYVLVAVGAQRDRRALSAAFNYLILGTIGATFFVIGVGFLYMATGSLNMVDMAGILASGEDTTVVRAGFAFILVGLGLKAALFPLHSWLPGAYAYAPSMISTFLAATATKVALYALIRFLFMVFDTNQAFQGMTLTYMIAPLAAVGMLAGSLQGVLQSDAKRVLAYSSVAQVGYILLGVSLATAAGISAGFLHLLNHALMKGALFMALGVLAMRMPMRRIGDLAGLASVMPVTAAAFAVGGLSLIGVPLTAGFVSKIALLVAVADAQWWWAIAVIAISSVLAFVYVGRMLEAIYLRAPSEALREACAGKSPPWIAIVPLVILAAANVWFGIDARPLEFLSDHAASVATKALIVIEASNAAFGEGAQ